MKALHQFFSEPFSINLYCLVTLNAIGMMLGSIIVRVWG